MANEELDQPFSPIDLLQNERRSTRANVVTSLEDDPEKASRAMELAKASGAHPALVHGDLEGFEAQYKTTLVSKLLNDNKYLSEYANSHPLAAKVSNDDWGNLDTVSSSVSKLGTGTLSVLGKAVQGFKENFDADSMQADQQKLAEWMQQNPLFGNIFVRQATQGVGLALEGSLRAFSGVIGGAAAGVGELAKQLGSNEAEADRLTRDLIVWAQVGLSGQAGWHGVRGARRPAWEEYKQKEVTKELNKFQDFYNEVKPYLDAGVEPPYGIHEVVDKMKENQSKLDLDNLSDALKEAQKSNTKERNPDLFAEFLRQHTEASIGISAEAVRKLYGDKPPLADDGKLGFVPRLAEQLTLAELGGGDIQVPLSLWLAHVPTEVAKAVHDDIRVRPGGVTKNEVKEAAEVRKVKADLEAFHGSPHEFDAFSMEKIGTGEGAQSYGHGLYFAENPEVASTYAKMGVQFVDKDGNKLPTGNQYRVRIKANKEQFLDWDKPYSEQPKAVQDAIAKLAASNPEIARRLDTLINGGLITRGEPDPKGMDLYSVVGRGATSKGLNNTSRGGKEADMAASKALRAAGIPGIKYLDQGSRQGGIPEKTLHPTEGELWTIYGKNAPYFKTEAEALAWDKPQATHNFVLFDDSLVEIIAKNDQAVVATRKAAALDTTLEDKAFGDLYDRLARGYDYTTDAGIKARIVPTKELLAEEKQIEKKMNDLLNRIAGKSVRRKIADYVGIGDREVQGAYISFDKTLPVILYSLKAENIPDTVRHEAIHFLRDYNFITKEEWATLETEAEAKGWLAKHKISERYAGQNLNRADLLEEAIAKEYGEWGSTAAKAAELTEKYSKKAGAAFEKIKEILSQIKQAIAEVFGHSPDVAKLFEMIESGEVAKRGPGEPSAGTKDIRPRTSEFQPELPQAGTTRMEDRAIFSKAAAIGMTVDQYKRYMKLIEKRNVEDQAAIAEIALKEERKHQTQEWKENSAIIRAEVAEDIRARPDIAADDFIRAGEHKLATDALTPEQASALPKSYVAKSGVHPDDLAGFFGYSTGSQLVDRVIALNQARDQAGMKPDAYIRRVIDAETERRMQAKYGDLDRNIIEEAKEHVLSETQMDLLHEETLALGMKAGSELSITKEQMKAWVKGEFDNTTVSAVSSDKYLAAAGKAGRNAEMHLLREEPGEAFKYKQQQYIAVTMAREAKALEKELERFDKTAKRFTPREVKGVEQEFTNFIHGLLLQAERPVRRSIQDIQDSIAKDGNTTLDAFQADKVRDGWELDISDRILQGDVKATDRMTVAEFRDFKDAIDNLAFIGKAVRQIDVAGKKVDFAEWKAEVLTNIQELPTRAKEKQNKLLYTWDASLTRMEEIVKDLDLRRQLGPMFNAMIRPMMDAKHKEYLLQEKLSKELGDIKTHGKAWQKTLKDSIENDFFLDPDTGMPFDLTREHMINIMLNFGNRSNIDKFTRGWVGKDKAGQFEAQLRQMIDRHATKEDWDFVQRMGDIFEGWRKDTDTLYHNLSGLAPRWIQIDPVATPHGEYRGWYFPIIYDKFYSSIEVIRDKPSSKDVMGADYFKATTANRHTKERTGFVDRVEFQNSIEQVATRMQQMMHDISYRAAVMDVGKIIYDRQIREAIRKHYGQEYENQLDPWLKDIANHFNQNEKANAAMNGMLHRARFNLSAHALGLNLKVIGSPDVGTLNPAAVARVMSNYTASVDLAWAKSKEIPHSYRNMDRDFRERLEQTIVKNGWDNVQATAVRWAFIPLVKVSQGFRIVTFVDQYKKALAKGMSETDAAALADSQVRLRHGATGIPDLPAIMRGSEGMKMATMFYGFFNAMENWQRGIPGQVRRGEYMKALETTYGAVVIPAIFGALLFNKADKDEPWWKTISKALSLELLGTVPLVRDLGSTIIEGIRPSTPIGSLFQAMANAYTDGKHYLQKKPIEKPISHAANVIGLGFGLPLAQIGRTSQFSADVYTGKQRPKNILEWTRGIIHGEIKPKR